MLTNAVVAQKVMSEATLTYKVSLDQKQTDRKETTSPGGTTYVVYIKGMQSRTDMVSSLGSESAIFDGKTGKGAILKEYSGQKLMITLTEDNWNKRRQYFSNLAFKPGSGKREIANYLCTEAFAETSDGRKITVWYMTEYQLSNRKYNNALSELPGIPAEFTLENGKRVYRYELQQVNFEPVPASKFELPKSGYRVMSFEESQQLKKGN